MVEHRCVDRTGKRLARIREARWGRIGGMIAFEISVNGQLRQVLCAPSVGGMSADICKINAPKADGSVQDVILRIVPTGIDWSRRNFLRWPDTDLQPGDVITILIVEGERFGDEPIRSQLASNTPAPPVS